MRALKAGAHLAAVDKSENSTLPSPSFLATFSDILDMILDLIFIKQV
jgi:hypothetical protein